MRIPDQLEQPLIIDANLEIRFSAPNPNIVTLVYNLLAQHEKGYEEIEAQPLPPIPVELINANPNLRYQATHRLLARDYYLSIGPSVIGLGCKIEDDKPYPGWSKYFQEFKDILNVLNPLGVRE